MKTNSNPGIYKITNIITNLIYIGSAVNLQQRYYDHVQSFRDNRHYNKHLQRAWNKYGEENFKFEILEVIEDKIKLLEREQHYLDQYPKDQKYNMRVKASSNLGIKYPPEYSAAISKRMSGRIVSEETRQKISEARKKIPLSPEFIRKGQEARKGLKPNLGRHWSQEYRDMMRDIKFGVKIKPPKIHICLQCQKEFSTFPCLVRKFCSPSCYAASRRKAL